MASTYSNLKVQLMTTGENSGTWGNVTNVNLGTALEEAIVGSSDVTFASADVDLTLTDTNATQTARNLRLNIVGTLGADRNLYLSTGANIEKVYIVNNGSAYNVTVRNKITGTPSGSSVVVPAGKTMYLYNTGTNIVDAITHLTSLTVAGTMTAANVAGDGSALTGLNASNISSGTIANARTTASSSNSASTIVSRDAGGNFSASTITADLTGNVTGNVTGNLTGTASNATVLQNARTIAIQDGVTGTATSFNGSANISIPVTGINASVIDTGTIANARTTASSSNGANTIVSRGASGEFSAGVITADGSALTSLNASNISSGTIANVRTTASSSNGASTIVSRDASGNFSANTITANVTGNLTGTASNATVLQTARTIALQDGVTGTATSFNGSANISIPVTGINVSVANSGTLAVNRGGTGVTASGTSGNVLTSNGSAWVSQTLSSISGSITPTTGSAPYFAARAWVNFDGTGAIGTNQTIRGSQNVTSVYKNGTGDYTITLTTAMPDTNCCVICNGTFDTAFVSSQQVRNGQEVGFMTSTSQIRLYTGSSGAGQSGDHQIAQVAVFR